MERPSYVAALAVPMLRQQMVEVVPDQLNVGHTADVLIERYIFMLRHGCPQDECSLCPKGKKRPTIYAARVFAQQYLLTNRKICPRIAELYVPLINFARPATPEPLVMRVRCGKLPEVEPPVAKPNIGIITRPQHVQKHKQKVKETVKEKPVENVGYYKLRRLTSQCIEKVIEITKDTKDDSFLRQILESLSDVEVLSQSFRDLPKYRMHKNVITNQVTVRVLFGELDRRHMPLLFDSLHRALLQMDVASLTLNKEIHCICMAWQALASVDGALEIGGLPLAITLVELGTQKENFKIRFEAFSHFFCGNFEMVFAKPVIRILQSLLEYNWNGQFIVDGFRSKCLKLLSALYAKHSKNEFLGPLFRNEFIAKTVLSDQYQRVFAAAFEYDGETLLDHPYLFSHSDKLALFEFWVVFNMEYRHTQGWCLRRVSRHFSNLGFQIDQTQSGYFGITVDRQDILHSVTKAIAGQNIFVLRRPMKVKYTGEQGIDLAGLTSDLLSKVIKTEICRCVQMNLLREKSAIWFQEGVDAPQEFKRLGVLIGLAMYNGVKSLPLDFPPMFYKKLLDEPLEVEDMKDFDPELLRGWKQFLDCDIDDLSFEYTYKLGPKVYTIVLDREGKHPKRVTASNREQYIQALFTAVTNTLIVKSFDALRAGLESVIPRRVLRLFTSEELQSLIAGHRVVDVPQTVELLKQVTVYDGFHPDDPIIRNLWNLLSQATPSQFSRFLDLITASDRIPATFPANFKLTIFRSGSDEEMLPRGQTCMHGLGLPAYSSAEKLREKLFIALDSFAAPGGDAFHLD